MQSNTKQLLLCGLEKCNYVLQNCISYTFIHYSVTGMSYLKVTAATQVFIHKFKK